MGRHIIVAVKCDTPKRGFRRVREVITRHRNVYGIGLKPRADDRFGRAHLNIICESAWFPLGEEVKLEPGYGLYIGDDSSLRVSPQESDENTRPGRVVGLLPTFRGVTVTHVVRTTRPESDIEHVRFLRRVRNGVKVLCHGLYGSLVGEEVVEKNAAGHFIKLDVPTDIDPKDPVTVDSGGEVKAGDRWLCTMPETKEREDRTSESGRPDVLSMRGAMEG